MAPIRQPSAPKIPKMAILFRPKSHFPNGAVGAVGCDVVVVAAIVGASRLARGTSGLAAGAVAMGGVGALGPAVVGRSLESDLVAIGWGAVEVPGAALTALAAHLGHLISALSQSGTEKAWLQLGQE